MASPTKEFVMTHVVENGQNLDTTDQFSKTEEHFGVSWKISFAQRYNHLAVFLCCILNSKYTSIDADFELRISNLESDEFNVLSVRHIRTFTDRGWGRWDFVSWDRLERHFLVAGKFTLEAHVKILKMNGCVREKLRTFDVMTKMSDVVLIVGGEKFHVLKTYLALHSTYFNSLFFGNFKESQESEVVLNDVDSEAFQHFLELIHGESAVDDNTIDGIIHLADMYECPTAVRRCEEFLLEKSKKPVEAKLQISIKYNLQKLKTECLSEVKTVEDIRSIVGSGDTSHLNHSVLTSLLRKSLSLH